MQRPIAILGLLISPLFASPAHAQRTTLGGNVELLPTPPATVTAAASVDAFLKANDRNGDRRLNADECPFAIRPSFRKIDLDHDGYLDEPELAAGLDGLLAPPRPRGDLVAGAVTVVVDDFLVEVYHNGEKVPDSRRTLDKEVFGACTETIRVDVREGDWLVFNVVNNRMRWGGASYFAVAGTGPGAGVGFVSDSKSGRWSYCDRPDDVAAFIALPGFLADQAVRPIENKWGEGDSEMNRLTDGWKGQAVWGGGRNTWIKYVAGRTPR